MNSYTLLVCFVLSLAAVNARGTPETSAEESEDTLGLEQIRRAREQAGSEIKHRRKRWHLGHAYQRPQTPYYPNDRRDDHYYDRDQQDLLPEILRLLDELSAYVRRPPPPPLPPQPIYVPYPVPYPVPQYCSCPTTGGVTMKPNVTERFPTMDDTNQNWGLVDEDDLNGGTVNILNGSRPISFDPITPIRPIAQRPVEHGSSQAGMSNSSPSLRPAPTPPPSQCDAAVLSCCGPTRTRVQQRKCFSSLGCDAKYTGNACTQESIANVLELFKNSYGVKNGME